MSPAGRARRSSRPRPAGRVPLNRALSKLGLLSRTQATAAISAGRVRVNGRIETNPLRPVVPEQAHIAIDDIARDRPRRRVVIVHKPRGVLTTRTDPEGRRTIYDVLGEAGAGLAPVGRLDRATTGLLLLTNDTHLAHRLTDPLRGVVRVYAVTVRGRVDENDADALISGVISRGERLTPVAVRVQKSSGRESHLLVELREGKNREVRRLFEAIGREVTRLKRVRFGKLDLGRLAPGDWRELSEVEIEQIDPGR